MKGYQHFLIMLLAFCAAGCLVPEISNGNVAAHPFSRYEIILQRKPFGEPPATPEPPPRPVQAAPEAPPFTQDLRLVALSDTDFGLRIGIVNVSSKKNYYLSVGEEFEGIQLLDASFEEEGVLLSKGEEELWLYMGGGSSAAPAAGQTAAARQPARTPSRVPPPPDSYRARMQRRADEQRRAEELRRRREQAFTPPELTGEDLQRHLREYNLELIRKAARGEAAGPPLPMELTPEEDQMLVQEGVLPPAE